MIKQKLDFAILDSIRGIAALYVTIAHCRGSLWMGGNEFMQQFPRDTWSWSDYLVFGSSMLTRLAVEFVIVFFLLSGFSIAHSLAGKSDWRGFYKRRLVRIYPPYVTAIIWAAIVFLFTGILFPQWYNGSFTEFSFVRTVEMNDFFEWKRILANLFYLPGDGFLTPFWSLTYEVMFYLLAPFVLRKVNLYLGISALIWLIHWLMPGVLKSIGLPAIIYEFLFVYNIYFAAGVCLYTYWGNVLNVFSKIGRNAHMFLLALGLLLMFAVNLKMQRETEYSFVVAGIFAFLLIVFFLRFEVRIPSLMKVGSYSYTLYITHFASIFLYLGFYWLLSGHRQAYISNYLVWMGAVPFCMAMAYFQYWLVERNSKNVLQQMRRMRS